MLNRIFLLLLLIGSASSIKAQSFDRNYKAKTSGSYVQDKNFYLLTVIQQNPELTELLTRQPMLKAVYAAKKAVLDSLEMSPEYAKRQLAALKFSDVDLQRILTAADLPEWERVIKTDMKPSGYFTRFEGQSEKDFMKAVLRQTLTGINHIIDVYGLGTMGRFPAIDSAFYVTGSLAYHKALIEALKKSQPVGNLFFEPSLQAALVLLAINKRDEAARFEPMTLGENRKTAEKIMVTNWSRYPYGAIVVPGNGPIGTERLSKNGKTRLKLAAERYDREQAPFIIVSGGNVHPFQTPYNEALEMKKELMSMYKIPESDIIIEPHARHTTTNIRNCNRLLYHYGFPIGKKMLITTDKKQADKIAVSEFITRCIEEIGHQPFIQLARISDFDLEYLPVIQSLFLDNTDPLDP
ncbi:YdcF family protein [Mucilaginibacter terrae]|uniref:YdcF family protein n=1 Tax=Mucilaginibacter terrae TaxID=1955052 RepID=UPI003633C853